MSNNIINKVWLVGSQHGDIELIDNFLEEGRWENGDDGKYVSKVMEIKEGDKIAMKSAFTMKNDLPFDNKGKLVSVMRIKAYGTVTKNHGDGLNLDVTWEESFDNKLWFFSTSRERIWEVRRESKQRYSDLIDFIFYNKEQDYERFMNNSIDVSFDWIDFYEELADKLLPYKNNRQELIEKLNRPLDSLNWRHCIYDTHDENGNRYMASDICPFTVYSIFNRGVTDSNRIAFCKALAKEFDLKSDIPTSFAGIPVVFNTAMMFYWFKVDRKDNDIDYLWNMFEASLNYKRNSSDETRRELLKAFDVVTQVSGIKWNITMGLYWTSPNVFMNLDGVNRSYFHELFPERRLRNFEPETYLETIEFLKSKFDDDSYEFSSFPEFSYNAWMRSQKQKSEQVDDVEKEVDNMEPNKIFISDEQTEEIFYLIDNRKNVVFQGVPGVGKTFNIKQLLKLKGVEDSNITTVQFHQSYAYEDFIEGLKPTSDGTYQVSDGVFKRFVADALNNPEEDYYFVIDEINRGNISKIFGELLMLIEADKRDSKYNVELPYSNEQFYVPENVYILCTMNTADRSLSLVDYALRRRFSFVTLKPAFNSDKFNSYMIESLGYTEDELTKINGKMTEVNEVIVNKLGENFVIGHSYFVISKDKRDSFSKFYRNIVKYDLLPTIEEYFFDDMDTINKLKEILES